MGSANGIDGEKGALLSSNKLQAVEDWLFVERRILVCASTATIAYLVGLAIRVLRHQWLVRDNGTQKCIDFTSMWISGTFAASSNPAGIYETSAWQAAWRNLTGLEGCLLSYGHTSYPPTLLFFTYPLGFMPYEVAFGTWLAATLLLYLAAMYLLIPRPAAIVAALTPFPLIFNLLLGQNGYLTAGLVGLSLVFVQRRPWLSGIFIGFLSYKPQFGVLFPFALLASRNWRALTSAAIGSLAVIIVATFAFGYEGWPTFIRSLLDRDFVALGTDDGARLTLQSAFGLLSAVGVQPWISWTAHLAVATVVVVIVCLIWAKPFPYSLQAAALCAGIVTVTPYVQVYDLCILSVAAAFFVRDGLTHGFLPGERAILSACFGGLYFLILPIGPIISVVLLALIARRVPMYFRRDSSLGFGFARWAWAEHTKL